MLRALPKRTLHRLRVDSELGFAVPFGPVASQLPFCQSAVSRDFTLVWQTLLADAAVAQEAESHTSLGAPEPNFGP